MSDSSIFQRYTTAVDALRTHFNSLGDALFAKETLSQYALSAEVQRAARLKETPTVGSDRFTLEEGLPALVDGLLPAGFRLSLVVTVYDFQAKLEVRGASAHLRFDCTEADFLEEGTPVSLPQEHVKPFEVLQNTLQPGETGLSFARICDLLDGLKSETVATRLSLHVFLDKTRASRELLSLASPRIPPKVVVFLFPEALVSRLRQISLASYEDGYCEHLRRTAIVAFGGAGWLSSELLAICGQDYEARLVEFLNRSISEETLRKTLKILEFQQAQGAWTFPTTWLTPDMFDLTTATTGDTDLTRALSHPLRGFQGILSAIFLADSVDAEGDGYWVAYSGLGQSRFVLSRDALLEKDPVKIRDLYHLYTYVYDGLSADKLEIAQQFLSLSAKDPTSLVENATEIREATEKTYSQVLIRKVEDYFEARHKVQERIKTATAETTQSIISLTRDVSADLYKIAGVLVGAVVAALIKPDLGAWTFLGAALVIAIYLSLVIFFHLKTMRQAYGMSMNQHREYVQSYQDVLRAQEIEESLGDKYLGNAEAAFSRKCDQATKIYGMFLAGAVILAAVSLLAVLGVLSLPLIPTTSTPTPIPSPTLTHTPTPTLFPTPTPTPIPIPSPTSPPPI